MHSFWKGPFATLNLGCSCLGAANKFLTGIYNAWFAHLHWRQALPPNRLAIIVEPSLGASMQLGRENATNPRVAGKLPPSPSPSPSIWGPFQGDEEPDTLDELKGRASHGQHRGLGL